MKTFYFAPLLLSCILASAQSPPAGSNWQRVTVLPANTSIHINGKHHLNCNFKSADDTSITCQHGGKSETVVKSDITSIKLARRGRSALAGAGIGAAGGLLIGAVATRGNSNGFGAVKAGVIGAFAGIGALIGAGVGAGTDFVPSTIYRAP